MHVDKLDILIVHPHHQAAHKLIKLLAHGFGPCVHLSLIDTPARAIASLQSGRYKLILAWFSPNASRMAFARLVRAAGTTPVLALLAAQDDAAGIEALNLGAHDYIYEEEQNAGLVKRQVLYALERQSIAADVESTIHEKEAHAVDAAEAYELHEAGQLLERLRVRDLATGLYSRHEIMRILEDELDAGQRGRYPVAFMLIELTELTAISQAYGIKARLAMLLHAAQRVSANLRGMNRAARYGENRLALILPGFYEIEAIGMGEVLRKLLERQSFLVSKEDGSDTSITLTASVGVAVALPQGSSGRDLASEAAAALHNAIVTTPRRGVLSNQMVEG